MTIPIHVKVKPYYRGRKTLDGAEYLFTFRWNIETQKWYMDIKGTSNDVDLKGKALLCGKDLLAPHGYHQLGELWVIDNGGVNEDPNYDDFGTRWTLEYTPRPIVTPAAAVVYLQEEVEIWVEINPYDTASRAAVVAYGDEVVMGEDLDISAMETWIEAEYGSSLSNLLVGTGDNWAGTAAQDIEMERSDLPVFADVRIKLAE